MSSLRTCLYAVLLATLLVVALATSTLASENSDMNFVGCFVRCKLGSPLKRCSEFCRKTKTRSSSEDANSDEDIMNAILGLISEDEDEHFEPTDKPTSKPIDSKLIWESYRNELFSFLKRGGDVKGVQLFRSPLVASWDSDAAELTSLANKITKWGVEFVPSNKTSVPEQYGAFLNSLKLTPGKTNSTDLTEAKALLASAEERLDTIRERCLALYERYLKMGTQEPYDQFEPKRCSTVRSAQQSVDEARFIVEDARRRNAGPDAAAFEAIEKFHADDGSFAWTEGAFSSLSRFRTRVQNGQADSFMISISKSSSQKQESSVYKNEWTWEELEKGQKNDFIIVNKKESSQFEFTTSADTFKMDIVASGYAAMNVAPASWMSQSVLKQYRNGPFNSTVNFFGKNGSFPLLAKTLYVLYKPIVRLYVEKKDAQTLKSLATKGKVQIGPFVADTIKCTPVKSQSSSSSSEITRVDLIVESEDPLIVAASFDIL